MQLTSGVARYRPALKHVVDIWNMNWDGYTALLFNKTYELFVFLSAAVLADVGYSFS